MIPRLLARRKEVAPLPRHAPPAVVMRDLVVAAMKLACGSPYGLPRGALSKPLARTTATPLGGLEARAVLRTGRTAGEPVELRFPTEDDSKYVQLAMNISSDFASAMLVVAQVPVAVLEALGQYPVEPGDGYVPGRRLLALAAQARGEFMFILDGELAGPLDEDKLKKRGCFEVGYARLGNPLATFAYACNVDALWRRLLI